MKKLVIGLSCLVFLAFLVQSYSFAQEESPKTGDKKFDSYLQRMNEEAKGDPEGFLRRLSERHNVPEQEIREAREKHGLDFGETYMATVLARRTNRKVGEVAEYYKQNKGQGWGVMAQRMGIKPGSPEFKQMKAEAKGHVDHLKAKNKMRKKELEREKEKEREKARQKAEKVKGETAGKGKIK
ncbi:MAG: hypothetical protein ACUVRL_06705 [Candidatus Saccharicenans sp.]|uniref:hypothetical protein n=1 Tax=Candidatus Saccharicenans sp. TaxID=2819258 RepID=UPI004049BB63